MKAATSSAERRVLEVIWSYRAGVPRVLELDLRRFARGEVLDLEVLPRVEVEGAREEVSGELLDLRVQSLHGVVAGTKRDRTRRSTAPRSASF